MAERRGFGALNSAERSALMARVRSKNTRPELIVRRIVHRLGFRYRLHRRDIPGCPDLAFIRKRKLIFVHGCFWHSHPGCALASMPASRPEYWAPKLERNRVRDEQVLSRLRASGWAVMLVWECETRDTALIADRVISFLADDNAGGKGRPRRRDQRNLTANVRPS